MNASDDQIGKKIDVLKALASHRIDEILKICNTKVRNDESPLFNSILSWFSNSNKP